MDHGFDGETVTQNESILYRLKMGDTLTPLDALNDPSIRSFRLSGRIWDLKKEGHNIETLKVHLPDGAIVAGYKMRRTEENGQMIF